MITTFRKDVKLLEKTISVKICFMFIMKKNIILKCVFSYMVLYRLDNIRINVEYIMYS